MRRRCERTPLHRLARFIAGAATLTVAATLAIAAQPSHDVAPYRVVGDGIPRPLAQMRGEAARGRALIVARDAANCVLCHAFPDASIRIAGDLGPSLQGVGRRLSVAQLRLRVVDNVRVNPASAMPSYHRVEGLVNVAAKFAGTPLLSAGEVEDVVAYLTTLQ